MTTRSDIPRLAASLAVLGTELEQKGQTTFDVLHGWMEGPRRVSKPGETGGGGTEVDAEDRRLELRDASRAAVHASEFVADLQLLDRAIQRVNRRMDMACPPDMSGIRNKRTGEFEPETATDMLAAGFCPNCFLCGVGAVPLAPAEGKSSVRRYADRCRPCGDFRRREDGLDKPKEIVIAHHEGRRLNATDEEKIIKAARAKINPKTKGKRRKGKKAA